MDANILGLSFIGALCAYAGYVTYSTPKPEKPTIKFPWGLETGKTKQIQSMHGDASMVTELRRRQTIQQVGRLSKSKLKEGRTLLGSKTGAIETFMLSSIHAERH